MPTKKQPLRKPIFVHLPVESIAHVADVSKATKKAQWRVIDDGLGTFRVPGQKELSTPAARQARVMANLRK